MSVFLGLALLASCEQSAAQLLTPPLRVAALPGLDATTFEPSGASEGSVGHALDLVYGYVSDHASIKTHEGRQVVLERAPASPYSAAELARRLAFRGLVVAEATDDRTVRAEFESAERASIFVTSGAGGVRSGPFVPRAGIPAPRLTLVNPETGVEIEPVGADWRAHWQLLLGGHVDVVPLILATDMSRLENETGLQRFEIDAGRFYALQLNPDRIELPQRRLIQHVVASMSDDRPTLPAHEVRDVAEPVAASLEGLEILAIDQAQEERVGLLAVTNAIWRATGERPTLTFLSLEDAIGRYESGAYTIFLMPFATPPERFYPSLLPGQRRRLAGVRHEPLIEAVNARDWSRAAEMVHSRALVIPAWVPRVYAVMATGRWCAPADIEPTADSWSWIARLRSCR